MKFSTASALISASIEQSIARGCKNLSAWLWRVFWKHISISEAIVFCRIPFYLSKNARHDRARAGIWRANLERITGTKCKIDYPELMRRRRLLESALYHSDAELAVMMNDCAVKLQAVREDVILNGYIPILAPFHICSDAIATVVGAMVPPIRCHAYSIYQKEVLAPDEAERLSFFRANLLRYHPDSPPARQRELFRELRAGVANMLIFPDAIPQLTNMLLERAMRTSKVTLFGREARLHCGAEEISRIAGGKTGGKLIPFYIYWQNNRLAIRIFEACESTDEIALCLEQALRECGDQWMLWHFPSTFYFNDGGRFDAWRC